jgi:uncharacterized short protein YbdD (DUF466 family)
MRSGIRRALGRALGRIWAGGLAWLRGFSGDDAYDRYLTHHARAHSGPPLTRRAFYREREERKWSGITRCC